MDSDNDAPEDIIKRPRRAPKPRGGSSRMEALERLKQAKQKGEKNKHLVIEEAPLYDYVSEEKYSKMVENRQFDDWVEDDGIVDGYVDDGREIFEDDETAEYEDRQRRKKRNDKSTESAGIKKNPNIMKPDDVHSGNIKSMFEKSAASSKKNRKNLSNPSGSVDNADDILGDILGELRQQPMPAPSSAPRPVIQRPTIKKPMPTFDNKPVTFGKPKAEETFHPESMGISVEADFESVESMDTIKPLSTESATVKNEAKEVVSHPEDSSDFDPALLSSIAAECEDSVAIKSEPLSQVKSEKTNQSKTTLPSFTSSDNSFVSAFADNEKPSAADVTIDASVLPLITNENGDKIMRVYWYDAYEDTMNRSSQVFIFGKVFVESLGRYTSVCLTLKNCERRLYVLPREGYTFLDCREEISQVLASKKIMRERYNKRELGHVSTFTDPSIPASAQYLEVRYPAEFPALPSDLSGKTFARIFGTTSPVLETLFVEKKMKGPCWIDIKNPVPAPGKVSWCKYEVHVTEPRNLSVYVPPPDAKSNVRPPDFTLVSLSFRFLTKTTGDKNNHHSHSEIVSVSGLVHSSFRFDKPAPRPAFQEQFTIITHPSDMRMPLDFKDTVRSRLPGIKVDTVPNERALLSLFVQKLAKYDPDIFVVHDFNGYQLDTLLNRYVLNNTRSW